MEPTPQLIYERRGSVGWITFNRPRSRNALTWTMYQRLEDLVGEFNADTSLRCVVMTGAAGAFVAGTDISQFREFRTEQDALDYEAMGDRLYTSLETLRVPLIAAIAGPCTGAGFGLAGVSDLRIASPSARLGLPIARTLGNCLSVANYARFSALIGPAKLKELIFLARLIPAEEALRIGLVSEVVPDEASLLPRAQELAAVLSNHAPLTMWATKEALRRIVREGTPQDGSDLVSTVYMSHDFREGLDAFLNKRQPVWTGS
ncbi:enoyl-CoA hydratase/isomerase family protein [Candidatus Nephthysia bennettiae]|uniref:Enoyl-CoA hydratase/isomerase family protein n=1 Tax=Candidatus Nephthysia bennettiae TaxID=3127016 RepID=A0A934K536_9BACT|nr:enoyl-CoA hydratase/isomerase family protein [Candidatus Dormibacteraeota bacterium]